MGGRAAAAIADELLRSGVTTALYRCLRGADREAAFQPEHVDTRRASVCGRQFIEDTRRLRSLHEHLLVDLSDASDQIAAIAFASADLILLPFLPHEANAEPFLRSIELLEIMSSHRPQPLRHAVFLASSDSIGPALHLEISGQLIRRGLMTLAVPFREQRPRTSGTASASMRPLAELGNNGNVPFAKTDIARFVECALDAARHSRQPTMPGALASG